MAVSSQKKPLHRKAATMGGKSSRIEVGGAGIQLLRGVERRLDGIKPRPVTTVIGRSGASLRRLEGGGRASDSSGELGPPCGKNRCDGRNVGEVAGVMLALAAPYPGCFTEGAA
jgi:hypothetical protein